jgi:hypothetical protein
MELNFYASIQRAQDWFVGENNPISEITFWVSRAIFSSVGFHWLARQAPCKSELSPFSSSGLRNSLSCLDHYVSGLFYKKLVSTINELRFLLR